jgi:hypothetical protein
MIMLFRSQLQVIMFDILEVEFPTNWPEIIPQILELFRSQNIDHVHGALFALETIVKRHQWYTAQNDRRSVMADVVAQTFPVLVQVYRLPNIESYLILFQLCPSCIIRSRYPLIHFSNLNPNPNFNCNSSRRKPKSFPISLLISTVKLRR